MKDWKEDCLKMKQEGESNREIARKLLGKSSQESKIRRYLKAISFNKDVIKKEENLKILLWDIETSVKRSWHFQQDKYLGSEQIDKDFFILSQAWQWYIKGDESSEVFGVKIDPQDAREEFDYDLILQAWHLLDQADVVVGHNVDRFDIKMTNARFLKYGLPPPSPYKTIDTYKIAKKFGLTFKSLKYLCKYLDLPVQKLDHRGLSLWIDATMGDEEALVDMLTYNKGDIPTLRLVYEKLVSWGSPVNIGSITNNKNEINVLRCPHCASGDVVLLGGHYFTNSHKYTAYRCNSCGGVSRSNNIKDNQNTILVKI